MLTLAVGFPAGAAAGPQAAQTGKPPAARAALIDLNSATPAELKLLPGIGDAYAKRIVDGRPYSAKNQLVTRGIVPQTTYAKIKDAVVARQAGASH